MVTDISIKRLLEMANGDTEGSFLVLVTADGIYFKHMTKEAIDEVKLAMPSDKEANA